MRLTALVLFLLFGPLPALAGLEFCNTTTEPVQVAIGYKGEKDWTSEGWWTLAPDECKIVQGGDLDRRYYYFRAVGDGLTFATENYYFCTGKSPFTIVKDTDCEERGYQREAFNQIELGDGVTSYTMTLTGPPEPAETAPPGRHGEPYTISGLFSHCDITDAGIQCELHAEGFRYVAYTDGDSPEEFFHDMLELTPNTPMEWVGDLRSYGGRTADVTIREARVAGSDPDADLRFELQGSWVSDDDSAYVLTIIGGLFEEWYDGVPTSTSLMEIRPLCGEAPPDGRYLALLSLNEDEELRCFDIVEAGANALVLWPVGGMHPLEFTANGL